MRLSGQDFDVDLERYSVQLSEQVGNSRLRVSDRTWLTLHVRSELGCGVGQACPLPGYTADDVSSATRSLAALSLRDLPTIRELSCDDHPAESLFRALDALDEGLAPSARFALETAILDLLARRRGLPLHGLLSAGAPAPLPLSGLLPLGDRRTQLAAAESLVAAGFFSLKLKLHAESEWPDQLEQLRALKQALPQSVLLRGDANGAWGVEFAAAALEQLARLDFEFIEEPVAPGLLPGLPISNVSLALDESLQSWGSAAHTQGQAQLNELATRSDLKLLVLKPTALGGFSRCIRLAQQARTLGLQVVVSHCFDGPVAHAAACELALALGCERACGLAPHAALRVGTAALPAQIQGAWLVPTQLLGHGFEPPR